MISKKLQGKRAVICEDEGVILMHYRHALSKAGAVIVGTEADGDAAVDLVLREAPDFVLIDVTLQGTDGVEATRRICDVRPTCVLLVSAQPDSILYEAATSAEASGYLVKPVSGETLIPVIEQALQRFYECSTS